MSDTVNGQVQSLAVKVKTVRDLLDSNKAQLAAALPKFMNADRLIRVAMTAINTTPKLIECTPRSLLAAVIQCGQLGLEPGVLGHIYLVPFQNRKRGTTEVQVIPGYKGLVDLCWRSGRVDGIGAHVIREGDVWEYEYGMHPKLVHKPGKGAGRKATHYYTVVRLKGGAILDPCVMSVEEVEAHRDKYSRAAKDGPWVTNFDDMALKTTLRMGIKLAPMSIDVGTAVVLSEKAENQLPQDLTGFTGLEEEELPAAADQPTGAGTLDKLAETVGKVQG